MASEANEMNNGTLPSVRDRYANLNGAKDIVPFRNVVEYRDAFGRQEPSIHDFLKILQKRKGLILFCILAFFGTALAYCITATDLYTATTAVEIRAYSPMLVGTQVESLFGVDTRKQDYQRTTIAKLKRYGIANRVLTRDNLAAEVKSYYANQRGQLAIFFRGMLRKVGIKPASDGNFIEDPTEKYNFDQNFLDKYLSLIDVNPVRDTSLVEISVTTADPVLSQKIANLHAREFIEAQGSERQDSIVSNLKQLQVQAEELKQKVTQAEKNLGQYAQDNELLAFSNSKEESMAMGQITDLNKLLAEATAKRIKSESLLKGVKESPDSTALDDESIGRLRVSLKEAEAQYADLSQKLTPAYPTMVQLRAKITSLQNTVAQQRGQAIRGLQAQYESDVASEQKLLEQVEQQKSKANEVSKRLIQYNILHRESESLRDLYQAVLKQLKEIEISSSSNGSNIYIGDYAALPEVPSAPMKKMIMVLSLFIGIVTGVGSALILELLDNTIKSAQDVHAAVGLPVLGIIPSFESKPEEVKKSFLQKTIGRIVSSKNSETYTSSGFPKKEETLPTKAKVGANEFFTISLPQAAISEALRTIRAGIILSSADQPLRRIMVTSANKGEGKTTLATNLAVTLAQASHKVVLIDTDLRQSKVDRRFGIPANTSGLVDFLAGQASFSDVIWSTSITNLDVITAGSISPNPTELVGSQKMEQLVEFLDAHYDYILLDTPPVIPVADSLMLSRLVDAVVLVVRSRVTEKVLAQEVFRRLSSVRARVLGVVVNDVDLSKVPEAPEAYSVKYYMVAGEEERRRSVG